jgi:hypothetical protein
LKKILSTVFQKIVYVMLRDSAGMWQGATKEQGKVRFTPSKICDLMAHNYFKGGNTSNGIKEYISQICEFHEYKKEPNYRIMQCKSFQRNTLFFNL